LSLILEINFSQQKISDKLIFDENLIICNEEHFINKPIKLHF
jgi:hypothetical protein